MFSDSVTPKQTVRISESEKPSDSAKLSEPVKFPESVQLSESVPLSELDSRRAQLFERLNTVSSDWQSVILAGRVNQLYFAGTMQDAILVFKRDGTRRLFVFRSYERACDESLLPPEEIVPMRSYREIATQLGENFGVTYVEKEILPLAMLERLNRYLKTPEIQAADPIIARVRAVKSPWELHWMELAGRRHNDFLIHILPTFLKEGMSETDFVGDLYAAALKHGHQGVSRFGMFQNEVAFGQFGFGESSLYPTCFNGPGGSRGMSAAVPFVASRTTFLEPGQSVFADMGYGVNGYNTDKTQVYFFHGTQPNAQIPDEARAAHEKCREIQLEIASQLRPGTIPAKIFGNIFENLSDEFRVNFQGFGARAVQFLGHGVGLQVDEFPVIARSFNEPLEENMVLAIEPKKGIAGFGTVGVEDTFVVTPSGGRCLTGGPREILEI